MTLMLPGRSALGAGTGRARPAGGYPAGVMDLSLPLFVIWL